MLTHGERKELERKVGDLVCSFCRIRHIRRRCFPECPLETYLPRGGVRCLHIPADSRVAEALEAVRNTRGRITAQEVARNVGLSLSRLSHLFKKETGESIRRCIRSHRLAIAIRLLLQTRLRISEICYSAGFRDTSNFSRTFKVEYGLSPSEFRARYSTSEDE